MNDYITAGEALQVIQDLMPILLFCFFMSCMMFLWFLYQVFEFIYWFNERKAFKKSSLNYPDNLEK